MEQSTIVKGAGSALVLGGGGAGAGFAVKEYMNTLVEYVDALEEDDEYLVKLGKAYKSYNLVYASFGDGYVKDIVDSIPRSRNEIDSRELGKNIRDWCKDKISKNEEEFKKKVEWWCIKRLTNAEKIEEEVKGSPKTTADEFTPNDGEKIRDALKSLNLVSEWSYFRWDNDNNKKQSSLRWCETKLAFLYYGDSSGVYNLMKEKCFK